MEEDPLVTDVGMLMRRPAEAVFEALVDPAVTTRFWFTRGSGRLEPGKRVRWQWETIDASADIDVEAVEPHERITYSWPGPEGTPTQVEWRFDPRADATTFVTVVNRGFTGEPADVAKEVIATTAGFTLVLAGMKAWLEHGIELNLVGDRFG